MTQNNEKKTKFSNDKVVQTAREIIEETPPWQRAYADEIIESAIAPASHSSIYPPKMLG